MTTPTDAPTCPAAASRALYTPRGAVELPFHQIQILLALDILRGKSPELIEKEPSMHFDRL